MQLGLLDSLNQFFLVSSVALLVSFHQVGATFATEFLRKGDSCAAVAARFTEMVAAALTELCVCSILSVAVTTEIACWLRDFLWRTHCHGCLAATGWEMIDLLA